jgi:hypothetical protein
MPLTQEGLPFQGLSPIARQNSYLAAKSVAASRGIKTQWYMAYLRQVKRATDHQAARRLKIPRSSICSIRNALCTAGLVEAVGSTIGRYGKRCTLWALRPVAAQERVAS